jgi:hypothetical protein
MSGWSTIGPARASRPWPWRVWVAVVRAARICCLEIIGIGISIRLY